LAARPRRLCGVVDPRRLPLPCGRF
jgi:hypothetical protein